MLVVGLYLMVQLWYNAPGQQYRQEIWKKYMASKSTRRQSVSGIKMKRGSPKHQRSSLEKEKTSQKEEGKKVDRTMHTESK